MRFLSMAALALVGAVMTGCSSDDSIIGQTQPQTENKSNAVTLTTTVSIGGGAATRALTADGTKTFAADEQIAVVYENTSSTMVKESVTLTAGDISADGKTATFTVSMTNPKASGSLKYIYPAAMAKADGSVNYDALNSQDGTLNTLSSSLDLALYEGSLTSEGTLPTGSISMTNPLAILAYTLKNSDGSSDITSGITGMTVSDGTNTYSVTRSAAAGPIYVAIRPTSSAAIEITATDGTNNYTKSLTGKTYVAGNGYSISLRMTKQVTTASTLSALKTLINNGTDCSSYLGWQVNSDGDIAESNVSGTLIGYVGYVSTSNVDTGVSGSRILVLASADASTGAQWGSHGTSRGLSFDDMRGYSYTNTLQGYGSDDSSGHPAAYAAWNYSAAIPSGGATPAHWFLPTQAQLTAIVSALGGWSSTFKTKVGWSSANYWSSTEDGASFAWSLGSNGNWTYNYKSSSYYVRSCFAY